MCYDTIQLDVNRESQSDKLGSRVDDSAQAFA